ncbi:hypothetical protein Agub_g5584, partial [Astrephomene gubernaculifera]
GLDKESGNVPMTYLDLLDFAMGACAMVAVVWHMRLLPQDGSCGGGVWESSSLGGPSVRGPLRADAGGCVGQGVASGGDEGRAVRWVGGAVVALCVFQRFLQRTGVAQQVVVQGSTKLIYSRQVFRGGLPLAS